MSSNFEENVGSFLRVDLIRGFPIESRTIGTSRSVAENATRKKERKKKKKGNCFINNSRGEKRLVGRLIGRARIDFCREIINDGRELSYLRERGFFFRDRLNGTSRLSRIFRMIVHFFASKSLFHP